MGYKGTENLSREQLKQEHLKINQCLDIIAPLVLGLLEAAFKGNGLEFTLTGKGLDLQYELSKGKLSMSMFLRNLFLEIVTTDRDLNTLLYDYQLDDPDFLLRRIFTIVGSKLAITLPLLNGKDIKEIEKLSANYERMRIAVLDGEKLSDDMKKKIDKGIFPVSEQSEDKSNERKK